MTSLQMKGLVFFAINGVFLTALGVMAFFLSIYGPCIEPYVFGYVVQINKPDQIYRGYVIKKESGREVEVGCFRLHNLQKLALGIPIKYSFDIEARLSDKIPVSAYLADNHHFQSESDLSTHYVGEKWDRSYCFEMPGTIADNQSIRVSGHAEHDRLVWGRRWPFWRSITPVPEFLMASEKCYRESLPAQDCPAP